jgi:DoxX-like family
VRGSPAGTPSSARETSRQCAPVHLRRDAPRTRHRRAAQTAARSRYRLIGVAELAATAGVLAGLWRHPLGVAAAAGMTLLLAGALITHRRAADSGKEMTPALLALAITAAYLAIALTS